MIKERKNLPIFSRWLILAGLLLAVAVILMLKDKPQPQASETAGETPEVQLAQALEAGLPVLAFYHSNSCKSCIEMMNLIHQVYPEFQEDVVLVDVNVYDSQNQALLQTVGLRYIPTQMLYDRSGKQQTIVGVMQPDQLRKALAAIQKED